MLYERIISHGKTKRMEIPKYPDPSKMPILRTRTPAIQVSTPPLEGPWGSLGIQHIRRLPRYSHPLAFVSCRIRTVIWTKVRFGFCVPLLGAVIVAINGSTAFQNFPAWQVGMRWEWDDSVDGRNAASPNMHKKPFKNH